MILSGWLEIFGVGQGEFCRGMCSKGHVFCGLQNMLSTDHALALDTPTRLAQSGSCADAVGHELSAAFGRHRVTKQPLAFYYQIANSYGEPLTIDGIQVRYPFLVERRGRVIHHDDVFVLTIYSNGQKLGSPKDMRDFGRAYGLSQIYSADDNHSLDLHRSRGPFGLHSHFTVRCEDGDHFFEQLARITGLSSIQKGELIQCLQTFSQHSACFSIDLNNGNLASRVTTAPVPPEAISAQYYQAMKYLFSITDHLPRQVLHPVQTFPTENREFAQQ